MELSDAIAGVRQLRIAAAHRLDMTEEDFRKHIRAAIHLVMVLEDPEQADKILNLANESLRRDGDAPMSAEDEGDEE